MTPEDKVIACENILLRAMKDCDRDVLDTLLHDDLLFNGPTGEKVTKEIDWRRLHSHAITKRL
ncbi:DUF4440 domain-containing protein [Prevotella sp. 10(H)]|uniref:DUF4440 domain-containing protein n=1 Tax=Prevotella sp. 10(H) TaxID=1158294 RepID=UPI00055C2D40|nr:DUF4440 domain-containing protein [Prevotella sp. 10(H)]